MSSSLYKNSSVWVSHSSLNDFKKCPRAYYLKNIYRDKETGNKIQIVTPALALGQAVHGALEPLANMKVEDRKKVDLLQTFENEWKKVSGKMGGFVFVDQETEYKERGLEMVKRVIKNPGPIFEKALKIKAKDDLLRIDLSKDENIILCGKIDWLQYVPENDSIKILDFKTGKNSEDSDSLQLPIYYLLVSRLQKRKVEGIKYWYLDRDDNPEEILMNNMQDAENRVLAKAIEVKEARIKQEFKCPKGEGGCFACKPFEEILSNNAEFIGTGNYGQDLYIMKSDTSEEGEIEPW